MPDALVACTLFVYWRYMLIEAVNLRIILRSLPAWGVRVEIPFDLSLQLYYRTSLPAWGVRVEIYSRRNENGISSSLPAWGVRVEIRRPPTLTTSSASLPAWGVRVEIADEGKGDQEGQRHSPHGECGLKCTSSTTARKSWCHSPHGECGLKSRRAPRDVRTFESLPAWGVRVEIGTSRS